MKILYIIDGLNKNIENHIETISNENDEIKLVEIKNEILNDCVGCFSCWLKTPGKCIFNDKMNDLYPLILQYEKIFLVSSIKMGFVSAKVKTFLDRMIPTVLPYFKIINNEFHHKQRYDHEYSFGIIMEKTEKTTDKDIELIKEYYKRVVLNFDRDLDSIHFLDKEVI